MTEAVVIKPCTTLFTVGAQPVTVWSLTVEHATRERATPLIWGMSPPT